MMITQLVVSVSIFSLVLSWTSLRSMSPLMYYEKLHYFPWNSLQFLSIAMNKNYIFLIFNGILFFLAKTSDFVRSPSSLNIEYMLQKIGDDLLMETELEPFSEENVTLKESDVASSTDDDGDGEVEEEETKTNKEAEEFECSNERAEEISISIVDSEEEGGISLHEDVEDDERDPKSCYLLDDDVAVDDDYQQIYGEEDETEKLSTEELNQKFEDFIRRMKEEFRISEARQQLVMVN